MNIPNAGKKGGLAVKYLIVPNFYAPKSPAYRGKFGSEKIHAVAYNQCNFRCAFCGFKKLKETNSIRIILLKRLTKSLKGLSRTDGGFKFTGGEPTLNPGLLDSLRCQKARRRRAGRYKCFQL